MIGLIILIWLLPIILYIVMTYFIWLKVQPDEDTLGEYFNRINEGYLNRKKYDFENPSIGAMFVPIANWFMLIVMAIYFAFSSLKVSNLKIRK